MLHNYCFLLLLLDAVYAFPSARASYYLQSNIQQSHKLILVSAMPSESCDNQISTFDALSFIIDICGKLKKIKRKGWLMRQVPGAESDADHMHRCAMLALLACQSPADPRDVYDETTLKFHPDHLNATKLLRMAVTHDVCEALAGDITPFCDSVDSKFDKEQAAMQQIRQLVGDPLGQELYDLWLEYEQQETPLALLVKDIDKFEMVCQAYEYERDYLQVKPVDIDPYADLIEGEPLPSVSEQPLRRFFKTTRSCLRSPLFRRLDRELREKREQMLMERGGWKVTDEERSNYESNTLHAP